jgi:hypothetical protein
LLPVCVQKLFVGSEFLQNDVELISHLNGLSPVYEQQLFASSQNNIEQTKYLYNLLVVISYKMILN